jgi:hypothetical protein
MIIALAGQRLEVEMVDYDDYAILAHRGPRNIFVPGRTYNINNRIWQVISNTPSQYIANVTNVKGRYI